MSGISGIVDWKRRIDKSQIQIMMDTVPYRAPDGEAIHCNGPLGMGFQFHKVTPESRNEVQPLVHNPTGIVLCADVRLDNRDEFSDYDNLAALSDSEIVLAAYLKDKRTWAEKLLGDFAIAIWDPMDRTVQLARDAMGMRSLYYYESPEKVVWATEVQQILSVAGVEKRLNESAVAAHLSGLIRQSGMSFYKNIAPVEAGDIVIISEKGKKIRRYWNADPQKKIRYKRASDYADHFRELFSRSVECRLRSIKPVGLSLSGGMDSGSVASTVGWLYEREKCCYTPEFRAYNWAFDELKQCDERQVSRLITNRYNFPSIDIPADDSWPLKDYPEHGPHGDDPFFGMYQFLIDRTVEKAAEDGVSVLLSGDRGDLLIGGTVLDLPGMLRAGRPAMMIKDMMTLNDLTGQTVPNIFKNHLIRPFVNKIRTERGKSLRFTSPVSYLTLPSHLRKDFITKNLDSGYIPPSLKYSSSDRAVRDRYSHIFTEIHMHGMIWSERTNARLGVGFADVWSDRRLAEFILSIPQYMVHRVHDQKLIVRRAMTGVMPSEALAGIRKVSPQPLYIKALRKKALHIVRDLSKDMLSAKAGYIDEDIFHREMEKLINGQIVMFDLWGALSLEMWLRRYWK